MDAVTSTGSLRAIDRLLIILVTIGTFFGNIIPLVGVLYWQWDTFQLVMLYWLETLVLALWTLARLARLPASQRGESTVNGKLRNETRASLVGFFALHSGMFMTVHLFFLISLFASEWHQKVQGARNVITELLFANGVWVALMFIVISHGIAFFNTPRRVPEPLETTQPGARRNKNGPVATIVGQLYVRIIIMQFAVVLSGWLSGRLGSLAPLVVIITLKTLVDFVTGVTPLMKKRSAVPARS